MVSITRNDSVTLLKEDMDDLWAVLDQVPGRTILPSGRMAAQVILSVYAACTQSAAPEGDADDSSAGAVK